MITAFEREAENRNRAGTIAEFDPKETSNQPLRYAAARYYRGKNMNGSKVNMWLSLAANFGVIIGLMLVALELQQNSELMRIQINQARADTAMLSNEQFFNSDYIPAIILKQRTEQVLSDEDWLRYVSWFRGINRNQDNVLSQYHAGMLEENTPRSVRDFALDVVWSSKYSRKAWKVTKVGYTDKYVTFIENALAEANNDQGSR